ncbi:hypothetical protein A3SI_08034 [Nitritalea halalkaliphila LW7]|uniref:Uncharacterized protein n=1 Tax=Nitritalea halalkaliphila LW7 TaxID=1189621 RepID=I5C5W1_9BACT|nr:TonB-dependent receptor [Nitritalea halalkaliphila]EIM77213.1 hypothetical protein A3SI_08034 [Nitritalea halalkaliphila LW7]
MKKIYYAWSVLLLFFVLQGVQAQGQRQGRALFMTGKVLEEGTNEGLIGANVIIRSMEDSVLVSTVTGANGEFSIQRPWVREVKLSISFIGYERFEKVLGIRDGLELGTIVLKEDSKVLGEVVVEGQVYVGEVRGDTTSFSASAFKTRENAEAEDLIRKLPGVTIQNGQIQARGENVQKVLVDGREFFGSDPFLALRNLPADVIDRVEILDQQNDQSRLTGFDDGNYSRTINIVLREDRRQGVFGRVYGGYGTDDRYSTGGNINFFKGTRRISVIGLFNNINQQNFASEDLGGVSGGGGGGRGGNNPFGASNDNGIITTNSVGINYSDRLGEKANLTASYFFNNSANNLLRLTNRELILGGGDRQFYEETLLNNSRSNNHRVNARLEYDINERHAIISTPNIRFSRNFNLGDREALNSAADLSPLSGLRSVTDNKNTSYNVSNNLVYRYKFDKRGRTLSTTIFTAFNQRDQLDELIARNTDFIRDIRDTLNQETIGLTEGFNYRATVQFTETLGEKSLLTLSYQVANNKTSADQQTFAMEPEIGIMVLDTALSNVFDNRFVVQRPSAGIRFNAGSWNINASLDYQYAVQDNESLFPTERVFNQSFSNFLPQVNAQYRNREKGNSLRIRYRTSTNEPSVNQLQNVIDNSNPLLLRVGNPDLGQAFTHNVFANYSKINIEKSRTFFVFLFASVTEDFIGSSTTVVRQDTLINGEVPLRPGGQLIQPVNLDGQIRSRLFTTFGSPIKKLKSQFNSNTSVSFNRTPGLINGERNLNDNIDLTQGITLTSNISKDVDFTIGTSGTYTIVNSSLQQNLNNNFYIQNSNIRLYYSPNNGKLYVSNVVNNSLFRGLSEGLDQSVWLWNIEFGYRFLKENRGELRLIIFDLLGQNQAIAREVNDISVTDTFTRVLTRYGLLNFTYNIGNFKAPTRQPAQSPFGGGRPPFTGGRSW